MAQREENFDPASDEEQRMLQKTLQDNSDDDRQLQLLLENSETMKLLLGILAEEGDILHTVLSIQEEIAQPQREFDQGLWPGIKHLFQKTLTMSDVNVAKGLRIKLDDYGEMKKANPSLNFQELPLKENAKYKRMGTTLKILDEELRWWTMRLVRVHYELDHRQYDLIWKDFVKVHEPKKGDTLHFYKLSNLEQKFGIVIEKTAV